MNGHIIPGTPIAVDFWKTRGCGKRYIHFLSHIHGDHIVGLTSTWDQPIYCSHFTAEILHRHYGLPKSVLRCLPLNESVIIQLPNSERTFTLTTFDANHCPGALMFYFQGDFGNVFYSGDFRFSSDIMLSDLKALQGKVDTLYLDNTFCSPLCKFPSKAECLSMIVDIVKQHPNHDIVIGMRKLGKEEILVELGIELDETIYVSSERLSIIKLLYDSNIFATLSDASNDTHRIRTVSFHQVSTTFINKLNEKTPTIAILPSAIFTGLPSKPFSRNQNVHVIPFSDHSSFPELVEFVKLLKPSCIIPVVTSKRGPFGIDISDRLDMSCFKSFLNNVPVKENHHLYGRNLDPDSVSKSQNKLTSLFYDSFSPINVCETSQNFNHNHEESLYTEAESSQTCLSQSRLKRKHSGSLYRKRKIAKGVCYIEDSSEDHKCNKIAHIHEGNKEEEILLHIHDTKSVQSSESSIVCQQTRSVLKEYCKDCFGNLGSLQHQGNITGSQKVDNIINPGKTGSSSNPDERDICLFSKTGLKSVVAEPDSPLVGSDTLSQGIIISEFTSPVDCSQTKNDQNDSLTGSEKKISERPENENSKKSIISALKSFIQNSDKLLGR